MEGKPCPTKRSAHSSAFEESLSHKENILEELGMVEGGRRGVEHHLVPNLSQGLK